MSLQEKAKKIFAKKKLNIKKLATPNEVLNITVQKAAEDFNQEISELETDVLGLLEEADNQIKETELGYDKCIQQCNKLELKEMKLEGMLEQIREVFEKHPKIQKDVVDQTDVRYFIDANEYDKWIKKLKSAVLDGETK